MRKKQWAAGLILIALLGACNDDPNLPAGDATPEPSVATTSSELPPITVDEPAPGATVTSPVTVSGTATVFEATVSIRLVGDDGSEIVSTFATATCGNGCRGDYSKKIEFEVVAEEGAVIEVFEESAEDGSHLHLVRIPVLLSP